MATNLSIDPKLIEAAQLVRCEESRRGAESLAMGRSGGRRRQKRLLELMGKLEWDAGYDYKAERSRG
jgi:hypothetical protein